ncbi:MAG: 6-bladed beta-propeller [Prolixibacteraceae bacterium]|jgi:hypothetical protein|nr:6-bladed beta-propeller [Prolixibacteraceae bacterium]
MKSILIIIITILLLGCDQRNKIKQNVPQKFKNTKVNIASELEKYERIENENLITIKIPEKFERTKQFLLDDIIDSIWYVPLETNKSSLIQYIDNVIPFEDNLFILDEYSKVILKFDSNGKFITQIGENGKGPKEYISPTSFKIINNQILVWDDRMSKVQYYDTDGNFVREQKLGFRMTNFTAFGKDQYICEIANRSNFHLGYINNYKLLICQSDWQVIGTGDNYNADIESGFCFSRASITTNGNQLIYNPSFDYFIYNIDQTGFHKKYFIDVGNRQLPLGYNENITNSDFSKKYMSLERNYMVLFQSVFETENHLVGFLDYKRQMIPFYFAKKSGRLICNKYYSYTSKYPFGLVRQLNT